MKKKAFLIIGAALLTLAIMPVLQNTVPTFFSAKLFPYSQNISSQQIFLPSDVVASPGETGEITLKAGNNFPSFAKDSLIGVRVVIQWPKEYMEFLGATLDETIFPENDSYEVSFTHDPLQNSAEIMVWTGEEEGIEISAGDDLINIPLKINNNAELGDEILLSLQEAEIAYGKETIQSYALTSLQGGVIRIGNPEAPHTLPPDAGNIFFEENLLAKPGEERLIALRSGMQEDLSGILLDIEYPESSLTFLGVETNGTALQDTKFEIITDTSLTNHIGILGATGNVQGASVNVGDPLLLFRFLVHQDVPLGTQIPLSLRKAQTVNNALQLVEQAESSGFLTVNTVSSLALVDAFPLSSTSIRLLFSDTLTSSHLDEIIFEPGLKNNETTLEVDGKSVILRNLTTMIPQQRYRVEGESSITGDLTGTLSPKENFAFFKGFPSQYPSSKFQIVSAEATSDTDVVTTFTEAVNPASIEASDFTIDGITIFTASILETNPKQILLTTSPQNAMPASAWLRIQNRSRIHDVQSTEDELLSRALAPLMPFEAVSEGPIIENVVARKNDVVEVIFDKALLGSSLTKEAFSIFEDGRTQNLITPETYIELSPDHTMVTFHHVRTIAGRTYTVRVTPGTLLSNGGENPSIDTFGNIHSFLGQSTFFTPWDFGMSSAEAIAADKVSILFSENVDPATISPSTFSIWTRDSAGLAREIKITNAEANGGEVILSTEAQKQEMPYFVLATESISSEYGEILGVPNSRGFMGYSEGNMRAVKVDPAQANIGEETTLLITGVHFPENITVRAGRTLVESTRISDTEIQITLPASLDIDSYDITVISEDGIESRIHNGILIVDPEREEKMKPIVLSEESYATPYRVPNDGATKTTLWVRIEDPRGVQDIEKVTADLRSIGGPAAASLSLWHLDETSTSSNERFDEGGAIIETVNDMAFIDGKAWYMLEVSVPSTIPTSNDPIFVPVTVENKTGRKGFGTVELMVNRDTESSIPPTIESATAMPDEVVPGDDTQVQFQVEISDDDGGGNVARVVLDATEVGLGIVVLQPLDEIQEDRECERTDYVIVKDWSDCISGVRTRIVELKTGLICDEVAENKPEEVKECVGGECTEDDWELDEDWSDCLNDIQEKDWSKKTTSSCQGTANKPDPVQRDCNVTDGDINAPAALGDPLGIMDFFFPKAHALTIFGNKTWYKSEPKNIPSWVEEGVYQLPVTVIDREGTEATSTITLRVARDAGGTPNIGSKDIYVSPEHSVPNDEKTPFRIFAKVTDPNGHEDLNSVTVNLSPIGLPPIEMQKGQIEGNGAWYSTDYLTVPRSVIPGYRTLEISVTDSDQNSFVRGFTFHVATPQQSGHPPKISADDSYTNPRVFVNDQESQGTLYIFVEEGDAPISHVSANLGTILQYTGLEEADDTEAVIPAPETEEDPFALLFEKAIAADAEDVFGGEGEAEDIEAGEGIQVETAPDYGEKVAVCHSTDTFGCMIAAPSEGSRGQWYYLPNLVVRENVPASQNPYYISVVATDIDGRRTEAEVPVYVGDGTLPLGFHDLPYLVTAVSTEKNEVQAYFSASVDPARITKEDFFITFYDDIHTRLPIRSIDIRSDGRVVTFKTNSMNEGDRYTLFADAEELGLRQTQLTDNQADFTVKDATDRKKFFEINSVESLDRNALELKFRKELNFSSVKTDGDNFTITEKGTGKELEVFGAQIMDDKTIILSTELQTPGAEYVVRAKNVLDYSGKALRQGTDIQIFSVDAAYGKNPFVITKTASKEIITVGENVEFKITVSNENNDEALVDVTLIDLFSSDILQIMNIDSSDAFSCGNTQNRIVCHIQEIPAGVKYSFTTTFKGVKSGLGTNSLLSVHNIPSEEISEVVDDAELDAQTIMKEFDREKTVLSSANVAVVDPGGPFLIRKTPDKVEAGINENITFRISITNRTEGQHYTNVNIVDDFQEQLIKLVEITPLSELSCENDASTITCSIPLFKPGETYVFDAHFLALNEGLVTNTVVATAEIPLDLRGEEPDNINDTVTGAASANLYIQNPFLNADFNKDKVVDFLDFSIFGSVYGTSGRGLPEADLNRDSKVDFLDFSVFAQQYGVQYNYAEIRVPEHEQTPSDNLKDEENKEGENEEEQPVDPDQNTPNQFGGPTVPPVPFPAN